MNTEDENLFTRIQERVGTQPSDLDVSDAPVLMLSIHEKGGHTTLLPYHALQLVGLQIEQLLAEKLVPPYIILEFEGANVHVEGYGLEALMRLVQEHRVRNLRVQSKALHAHGCIINLIRCAQPNNR